MKSLILKIGPSHLSLLFLFSLMLPVVILLFTERNPFWISLVGCLIPLGFYSMFVALAQRSGVMVWLGLPLIFLSAFQIIISYLFGRSVVATDMFLNLLTTNVGEAGELLVNIYPAVVFVGLIYLVILSLAVAHLCQGRLLDRRFRRRMMLSGGAVFMTGCLILGLCCRFQARRVLRDEIFPINVAYNFGLAISETYKIKHYEESSFGFNYRALRTDVLECREVYVLIIGEASRAASWQLFGYHRATNPELSQRDDVIPFGNVLTLSNTTHKSVPMILSSVHPSQHDELYRRKGLPKLFNEAGFMTYFISTQSPQGAMIDNLACGAQRVIYAPSPCLDMQLCELLRQTLQQDQSPKILFILHSYGSHFSYHQRYPREFAHFLPDDDVVIKSSNAEMIRNAYDNSIMYTDYFLNEIIAFLGGMEGVASAMLYCADHGEDLFDSSRRGFLHSSPTVTYNQLHVASLAWFSEHYKTLFPARIYSAKRNSMAPATTYSVFHTMAEIASISSPYVDYGASLVNRYFDFSSTRYYLNDHNCSVRLDSEIGIDEHEQALFSTHGIEL